MNDIIHLYHLQMIDHQLDKIAIRLGEIAALLESSEELQIAQVTAQKATEKTDTEKTKMRKIEDASEKQRLKIKLDEASLYGGRIHNPKELQDLQNEIASLKKYQVQLDEQVLETMLSLEEAENEQRIAEAHLAQVQINLMEKRSSLQGEFTNLSKQKERLQTEKDAATNSIVPEHLELYLLLRKQKRGTAISLIVDGGCSSCGSTLPPADKQAARSPTNTVYCSSCGRILYAG